MSAIPEEFIRKTARLSEESTRPFPGSKKIYVEGSRPDIQVPMREISQSDTGGIFGVEKNPPIPVYDTSGPYTDPNVTINPCCINEPPALPTLAPTTSIAAFPLTFDS